MNIKSQKDFFSGLMFMAVGIAFAWGATTYKVGDKVFGFNDKTCGHYLQSHGGRD